MPHPSASGKPTAPAPLTAEAAHRFLTRFTYGPRPGDVADLCRMGISAWLDGQLAQAAPGSPDGARPALDALTLRIRYDAGENWPAVNDMRPLNCLDKPLADLWALNKQGAKQPYQERIRPHLEVAAATLVRAVHDPAQVREVMVAFWHDHFSVNGGDSYISPTLPSYDAALRAGALGNFRPLLGAVAASPAMLIYLNNRSSRGGAANENYGRELFELHTLGRAAYLNAQYDRWRDVPGALQGTPEGFIDQDVYEASRAFTGWTLETGQNIGGQPLPDTGDFTYIETWHDNYQKRVLAQEFDSYQPDLSDGHRVLDLVAAHPATARHVTGKLIRHLLGGDPPPALWNAAAACWLDNRQHPDQIARVLRLVALSPEATANAKGPPEATASAKGQPEAMAGAKGPPEAAAPEGRPKRPLELVAGFARATGLPMAPSEGLINAIDAAGQKLFAWPTPDGHPVEAAYWLGAQNMKARWSLALGLAEGAWMPPLPTAPLTAGTGGGGPVRSGDLLDALSQRLLGRGDAATRDTILAALALPADAPPVVDGKGGDAAVRRLAAYVAMTPAFHLR